MVRGGSWNYPQGRARSAYRGWLNTGKGNGKDGNGFRVARSLPSSETDYVAIPLGQQVHALLAGFEAYDSGDYEAAVLEWQALANKGHAVAQFNLGVMYQLGLGVGQDNAEAVNWYRMAAEQGNAKAQQNIGYMYMKGLGLAQSSTQALKWYREAANQGNAATQYLLGSLYAGDPDGQQDYVLAYMWLNLASRQGYEGAADARTAVASNMTDEQLSEARKLVLNWEPK